MSTIRFGHVGKVSASCFLIRLNDDPWDSSGLYGNSLELISLECAILWFCAFTNSRADGNKKYCTVVIFLHERRKHPCTKSL